MEKKNSIMNILNKLNDWLGEKISYWLSTMTMFYLISILIIIPLFFQRPDTLVGWMQYIISVFFQGAALPVLGYVARQVGDKQEKLIEETHKMVMEQFTDMQNENNSLKEIIQDIQQQQELQKKEDDELKVILEDINAQQELRKKQNENLLNILSNHQKLENIVIEQSSEIKKILSLVESMQKR